MAFVLKNSRLDIVLIVYLQYALVFSARSVQCATNMHHRSDDLRFKMSDNYLRIQERVGDTVSNWEAHVQAVQACSTASLDALTDGKWYVSAQGHYLFEPNSCSLRRIPGHVARRCVEAYYATSRPTQSLRRSPCLPPPVRARKFLLYRLETFFGICSCLNGKHIVFGGDSVTRYQYISLAFFVSQLQYMEQYGAQPGHPSFCIEKEWVDWEEYYHHTSTVLGRVADGCGFEVCDCSRGRNASHDKIREYRTLHISSRDKHCWGTNLRPRLGTVDEAFVTLSYHQVFKYPDPVTAGQDMIKYYEHSYRQQPADILIFNMGLHIADLGAQYNTTMSTILESGAAVKEKHNTLMMWKTTTNVTEFRNLEMQLADYNGYTVYDIGRIVASGDTQGLGFRWDPLHFLPFVYEQFNDVLLNFLCKDYE